MTDDLVVRGAASAEEIAAVLAVLSGGSSVVEPTGYEQWRDVRRRALRKGEYTNS